MINKLKKYLTKEAISNTVTLCIGIAFYLVLSHISVLGGLISRILGILSSFLYAFALAFVLSMPVDWLERKIFTNSKSKHGLSVLTVYIAFFFIIISLFTAILPQIGSSISSIVEAMPGFITRTTEFAEKLLREYNISEALSARLEDIAQTSLATIYEMSKKVVPGILNFTISVGNAVFQIIMVVIVALYMLMEKKKLCFQIKRMTYAFSTKEIADRMVELVHRSDKIFSEFLSSKALDSLIIGLIAYLGMIFIYPEYSMLIALIIGVTNMIPFFGPFIGAIPSVIIVLMVAPMKALILAFFILILQQIDGNIIGPKIMGNSLGLSSLWILVAITIGGGLYGIVGMIIGVPAFALVYSIVAENVDKKLEEKKIAVDRNNFKMVIPDEEVNNAD